MADLGLLAGLSEGIKGGLQGYQTERRYQDEKAKEEAERDAKRRQFAAELMSKGMTQDASGGYGFTEQESEKRKLDMDKLRAEALALRAKAARGGEDALLIETREQRLQDMRDRKEQRDREEKRVGDDAANKATERLSHNLGNSQDAVRTLKDVESQIGFSLDDYDTKTNRAFNSEKGKDSAVDLPGVSIPGLGRVTAFSGAGRSLNDTAVKLFNIKLKDRSGSAVTSPELERLNAEFSQGKFNSEPELLRAMQDYKRALMGTMKDIEAANPSAASRYAEQGGTTSAGLLTSKRGPGLVQQSAAPKVPGQFPMQVSNGNETATVSNEQELAEAQKEGFK